MKHLYPRKPVYYIVFFLFSLLIFTNSCNSPDDPPSPEPTPTITHTVNINGPSIQGATYIIFDNGGELDGATADAQGDVKLSFINKEKTTVVDSVFGEADGYTRWVVKNQSIGTSKSYTSILNAITNKTANATFKLIDNITKETIENLLVTYNGTTTPIDSTFSLNNVSLGDYNITFKKSDSTWMIIPDITKQINLVEGDTVFTYEIDATKKQFFANLGVTTKDSDDNAIQGAVLTANDKNATTDANGIATIENVVELPAQTVKQWLAGTKEQKYNLAKESYNAVDEQTVTLNEGDNNYNHTLTKTAEKTANAIFKLKDKVTKETIENLLVTYNGTTTPIDSTFSLNNVSLGNYSITFKKSDSTWMIIPDISKVANLVEGDNVFTYEVDATKKQFFANLAVNVDDQDNQDLEGVILSANGKTATSASNGRATITDVAELPAQAVKQWLAGTKNVTYDLVKDGYKDFAAKTVNLIEGNNVYDAIMNENDPVNSNEFGTINVAGQLNGTLLTDVKITMINNQTPDSTYVINTGGNFVATFPHLYVADGNNPTTYTIDFQDNRSDGTFIETEGQLTISQGTNSNQTIILNAIPNEVNITKTVYNYNTTNRESGVTVKLYLTDSNTLLGTGVTDNNGEVVFENVPGNTNIHFENEKSGFFGKVNSSYTTELVDLISEMTDENNMTALPHFNLRDGTPVTAYDLNKYNTTVFDTDFIIGKKHIYLPDISGGNQIYKDHFNEVATQVGNPGAFIFVNSALPNPTSTMLANYNPYPQNQQIYDNMGSNVTEYNGTNTNTSETTLFNGNKATTHTIKWDLGGINDWSGTDHEIINAMTKIPTLSYVLTSRNIDGGANSSIKDSKYDSGIIPVIIGGAIYHYKTTDASGKNIEHTLPKEYK